MIKVVIFCIALLVLATKPTNAQSFVPDAVFQVFNVTYVSGGTTQTASVNTEPFVNAAAATSNTLGPNTVTVMNACSTTFPPCDSNANCTDINGTLGIVQCKCRSGFNQTASTQTFSLSNGTDIIPDGTNCPDIDECAGNSTVCGVGTSNCFNSAGGYSCNCSAGFSYNSGTRLCSDVDECSNSTLNNCHTNATCNNSIGSFTCQCNRGFSGNGVNCTEIDECTTRNITCGPNGSCRDPANALYVCDCNTGFRENTTADPKVCEDIDECAAGGSNNCSTNAQCTNTAGGFTCACNSGYTGNGVNCNDIDECSNNPCHANATCTNSAGSFSCACNTGFSGNGTFCAVSTLDFCYRLSITFNDPTSGNTSSRANDADDAVTGFLNELVNGSVGFSYQNYTYTFEAVLGNNTVTEFIINLCLNGSSQSPSGLTGILQNFTFTTTINNQVISVLEYNECVTNYGNCSDDANCFNTDGNFYCTCFDTHADRSTSGVNGTTCELPTNFTCSSNTVNVTAYNPYFENLGINYTDLYLGTCGGTLNGDDILYAGECGAVVESNNTHLFYKWNLTNVNSSAAITIGNYVTIPITCTFLASQNVSFNVSAERRDIIFRPDLNNNPGEAYNFVVIPYADRSTSVRLTGSINTNTPIFFRLGTSNPLSSNVVIQCTRFTTSAADGSSGSLLLIRNGCPVPRTDSNSRILSTLGIVRNGQSSSAVVAVNSHFFGQSRITLATFELSVCTGNGCEFNCTARRKRHIITFRIKRETLGSGEVQFPFQRSPDDGCTRDCNEGGICVYDASRNQECVCADGFVRQEDGTCRDENKRNETPVSTNTTLIVLIALVVFVVVLVGILLLVFLFRRSRESSKEHQSSSGYVNTNAIESYKME